MTPLAFLTLTLAPLHNPTPPAPLPSIEAGYLPLDLAVQSGPPKPRVADSTYLRITGGLVTMQDSNGPDEDIEFNEGFMLSAGIGHRLGATQSGLGFGFEFDGIWTDQDADNTGAIQALNDVTTAGPLLNGILDFRVADTVTVYGGAGVGAAWLDVGTKSDTLHSFKEEDGPFLAWQAKAGIAWHLGSYTALLFGYRFVNIDDAEIDDGLGNASFDLKTRQHILEAGLVIGL